MQLNDNGIEPFQVNYVLLCFKFNIQKTEAQDSPKAAVEF